MPVAVLRPAEPAGRVDPDPSGVGTQEGTQGPFQTDEPTLPHLGDPAVPQLAEDPPRPDEAVVAGRGQGDHLAPPVPRVGGAVDVAELLEPGDGAGRGLLGHAEGVGEGARARRPPSDGLEGEPVGGADVRVALGGQPGVEVVDQGPEPGQQEEGQFGAGMSLWLTAMEPGAQGPWHRLDGEQVLTVLAGAVTLEHAGTTVRLRPGDAAVTPADEERRLTADADRGTEMACAAGRPLRAHDGEGADRGIPDWMR